MCEKVWGKGGRSGSEDASVDSSANFCGNK